jgi:hypothetical protein
MKSVAREVDIRDVTEVLTLLWRDQAGVPAEKKHRDVHIASDDIGQKISELQAAVG